MGAAIRSLGILLLGYPILLALVALVVLVGIVVILKVLVYDPIMAEQAKRQADKMKQLQHEEWERGLSPRGVGQERRVRRQRRGSPWKGDARE